MDESIAKLKLGTFCGRRAARRQLAEAERTVELFPALSRKELARTVCEHLDWRAGSGEPGERLECGLSELGGVSLEAAQSEGDRALSDELVDRCRELGHAGRRAAI